MGDGEWMIWSKVLDKRRRASILEVSSLDTRESSARAKEELDKVGRGAMASAYLPCWSLYSCT